MAYDLKKIMAEKPSRFTEGHRMCAGCGAPVVARMVLRALKPEDHAVIANATGCMEVSTFIYPYTAWTDSFIHTAFENAGATCSGAEAAYRSLKKQGKLPQDKDTKFIAFGGDGGTYDIGLQSLSGAMERGHDMVYVCYDNGAYMNTGIQRSSATPKFADTTTSPAGKVIPGKMQVRKDLTEIIYQAIEKKIPYGIYNATNEGYTTWYDFTKEILAEQGIECKVNPVTTEEYIEMMKVTQAKRPFNSQMSKAKLEACGIKVPEWKDGLKRYLEEAKNLEQ